MIPTHWFLILSAILFTIGVCGVPSAEERAVGISRDRGVGEGSEQASDHDDGHDERQDRAPESAVPVPPATAVEHAIEQIGRRPVAGGLPVEEVVEISHLGPPTSFGGLP